MRTSNKNDAKGFNKLALLASAAATAAFVISQTRLMQRLAEPDGSISTLTPPDRDESPSDNIPETDDLGAEAGVQTTDHAQATDEAQETGSIVATDDVQTAEDRAVTPDVAPAQYDTPKEPRAELPAEADENDAEHDDSTNGDGPPSQSGSGRLRFQPPRSARERLHYGLPVSSKRRSRHRTIASKHDFGVEAEPDAVSTILETTAPVALLAPPAPKAPLTEEVEFDAEYLAICEAIARDGRLEEVEEPEAEAQAEAPLEPVASTKTRDALEDMWWLPAPKLQYILLALAYVAVSAAVGSDPVTLGAAGVRALGTVSSVADFVFLGWIFCGVILVLPLGSIAMRLLSVITRGKLHAPGFVSRGAIESVSWSMRLLATSAFLAGVVLYTPQALSLALDTDHPVAAVSSSTMEPALHEGELVLIQGVDKIDQLKPGDIIAFSYRDGIAIRRVANVANGKIVARSDASPDENIVVPFNDIAGRVLTVAGTQVKLPLLGNISLLGEKTVEPAPGPLSILP
jgi:signal peptidase I